MLETKVAATDGVADVTTEPMEQYMHGDLAQVGKV